MHGSNFIIPRLDDPAYSVGRNGRRSLQRIAYQVSCVPKGSATERTGPQSLDLILCHPDPNPFDASPCNGCHQHVYLQKFGA